MKQIILFAILFVLGAALVIFASQPVIQHYDSSLILYPEKLEIVHF